MKRFMLVLHDRMEDNPFLTMSPEEMQAAIGRYMAWGQELEAAGKLDGSAKLADEGGKQMTRQGDEVVVVDGPYAEAKEVIGGYYMLLAESYDEAVDLCRDHPHLAFGGRIDVRALDPMTEEG